MVAEVGWFCCHSRARNCCLVRPAAHASAFGTNMPLDHGIAFHMNRHGKDARGRDSYIAGVSLACHVKPHACGAAMAFIAHRPVVQATAAEPRNPAEDLADAPGVVPCLMTVHSDICVVQQRSRRT